MKFTGNIYYNSHILRGTLNINDDKNEFKTGISNTGKYGTLLPLAVNSHTHIGDSFIKEEPAGTLPEIVGPGGLKHRMLARATDSEIISGIDKSIEFMKNTGTGAFIDFREDMRGIINIKKSINAGIGGIALARPLEGIRIDDIIKIADGIGISSISDIDYEMVMEASIKAHKAGKIMALHFSENFRENIEKVIELKPDFLVHVIEASDDDLKLISEHKIPVAITPRSNIFYGKRPDYSRFLKYGIRLLLGTDNVFVTEPDIFSEMDFLYRYQRFNGYIEPKTILNMVIDNPQKLMLKHNISFNKSYLFFENNLLNEYEVITKKHFYNYRIVGQHELKDL